MWSKFYPRNCPPSEAEDASGTVYRLVGNNPPTDDDFKPYRVEQPLKNFGENTCMACGLSVMRDMDDCYKLQRRIPSQRGKDIAAGTLTQSDGKLMSTPNREKSHHTWWVAAASMPRTAFAVVAAGLPSDLDEAA